MVVSSKEFQETSITGSHDNKLASKTYLRFKDNKNDIKNAISSLLLVIFVLCITRRKGKHNIYYTLYVVYSVNNIQNSCAGIFLKNIP